MPFEVFIEGKAIDDLACRGGDGLGSESQGRSSGTDNLEVLGLSDRSALDNSARAGLLTKSKSEGFSTCNPHHNVPRTLDGGTSGTLLLISRRAFVEPSTYSHLQCA